MNEQKKSATQSVLATIEKEKVTPIPRWHFIVRNIFIWVSGTILLIAGALSVSLILFALSGSAWQLRGVIGRSTFEHALIVLPFIWIIAFFVFVLGADYALRHTKRGYRYPLWVITLVILVGSVIGGAALHAAKMNDLTDNILGNHIPQYKTVEKKRAILMHRPDDGRVMGRVISVENDQIKLQNHIFDEQWIIDGSGNQHNIEPGMKVLAIGAKGTGKNFNATEIIILPAHEGWHMKARQPVPGAPVSDEYPREQQHKGSEQFMQQQKEQEYERPQFMEEDRYRMEEGQDGTVKGMHRERNSE